MKAKNSQWWRGGVVYQIYPRSYQDSNNDGIGDLVGITQRLPYIAALGVDAIWLSPFFKSPMKDFGYDVSDYCDIDPMFGTLEDAKIMIKTAHDLGIKVIIDQVLSHSSDQHPWFIESRSSRSNDKADWYVWANAKQDGNPPNNWLSIFGGSAWQWDTRRRQYYMHNFLTSQPDLNFHNPQVQQALLDSVRFWLDLGIDGFRLDTANFYVHDAQLRDNPPRGEPTGFDPAVPTTNPYSWQWHKYDKSQPENLDFMRRLRALVDEYPDTTMVGEIGDDDGLARMAEYTKGDDLLHMAYCFDLLGDAHDATFIHGVLSRFNEIAQDSWPSWALSNHDCKRLASRWGQDSNNLHQLKTFAAFQLSLRGSPCVYQGDELGLTEANIAFEDLQDPYGITMWPEFKGRDGCRTPMPWQEDQYHAGFSNVQPWLPVATEHLNKSVLTQQQTPGSLLHFYQQFLNWRKGQATLQKGDMQLLPHHQQVVAFTRQYQGQTLLCVFNFSDQAVTWTLPSSITQCSAINTTGLSGAVVQTSQIELAAWGSLIAEVTTV